MNLSKLNHVLRDKSVTLRYETVVAASMACNGIVVILKAMSYFGVLIDKLGMNSEKLIQQLDTAGEELTQAILLARETFKEVALEIAREGAKEESE